MQINENEIQINKNEELSQIFPSTKEELNELQKSISPKERIKDGIYLWKEGMFIVKDEAGKLHKSIFMNGEWVGGKPARYTNIYDLTGKEYIRARDWEKNRKETNVQKPAIKEPIKDTEFITYLKEKNIIPDIKNSTVYYIPVEDGKGKIVRYEAMYIRNDNPSEVIQFPIKDINGNIVRFQTITRNIGLEKPLVDPIDFISLGGGIRMSFAKGLTTLAPKAGINLSKTAIRQISKGGLFMEVLGQIIPKEALQLFIQGGSNN